MKRVGVIGAGFAGLAAADALRANGAEVTVLEARDRVGDACGFLTATGSATLVEWLRSPGRKSQTNSPATSPGSIETRPRTTSSSPQMLTQHIEIGSTAS